jgi:hypothetical protein
VNTVEVPVTSPRATSVRPVSATFPTISASLTTGTSAETPAAAAAAPVTSRRAGIAATLPMRDATGSTDTIAPTGASIGLHSIGSAQWPTQNTTDAEHELRILLMVFRCLRSAIICTGRNRDSTGR